MLYLKYALLLLALLAAERWINVQPADGSPQTNGEGGSPSPPKP